MKADRFIPTGKQWAPPPGAIPWRRGRPDAIWSAPRCQSVLKFHHIYPPYEKMDDYLLAVSIAQDISDLRLKRAGINFWTMTGPELIRALEKMLE